MKENCVNKLLSSFGIQSANRIQRGESWKRAPLKGQVVKNFQAFVDSSDNFGKRKY